MRQTKFLFPFYLLLVLLVLSGCASSKKFDVRILWPPPPADPKLEWVGVYSSELDMPRTGLQQSFDKFTGSLGEQKFISPFDIVGTDSGKVYVSDIHLRNVRVYDFTNGSVGDLTAEGIFKTPVGMDLDEVGNLYVVDSGHGKILVFSPEGKYLRSFGEPETFRAPANIHINRKLKRIYVSDAKLNKIFYFDMQFNLLGSIGRSGDGEGQLHSPQGMAFDDQNNLYIADYLNARISVFSADGKFLRSFGSRGDQIYNFEGPRDLAFDSDGNLHIVDARKGLLLTYSPEGRLLMTTGGGDNVLHPLNFASPKGIFIDSRDRIYVADQLNRRFSIYQFLSKKYLKKNPISEADFQRLMEYLKQKKGK